MIKMCDVNWVLGFGQRYLSSLLCTNWTFYAIAWILWIHTYPVFLSVLSEVHFTITKANSLQEFFDDDFCWSCGPSKLCLKNCTHFHRRRIRRRSRRRSRRWRRRRRRRRRRRKSFLTRIHTNIIFDRIFIDVRTSEFSLTALHWRIRIILHLPGRSQLESKATVKLFLLSTCADYFCTSPLIKVEYCLKKQTGSPKMTSSAWQNMLGLYTAQCISTHIQVWKSSHLWPIFIAKSLNSADTLKLSNPALCSLKYLKAG